MKHVLCRNRSVKHKRPEVEKRCENPGCVLKFLVKKGRGDQKCCDKQCAAQLARLRLSKPILS